MAVAGQGFLSLVSEKVREFSDEPGASSKFSDARILDMMRRAWADVLDDINRVSSGKIRARIDIAIVADQREYALPPNIGQFLEFKKLSDEGYLEWEVLPNHPLSPWGPQFNIEGPMLYLDPKWRQGYTMQIDYVPTAEVPIFEATAPAGGVTTSTIKPPASVTAGTVDLRPSAYLGYVVRILSDTNGAQQERVVSSQDSTTPIQPILTVKPDWSPALTDDAATIFEVVPQQAYRYQDLIALKASRFIASITGDRKRVETLQVEYRDSIRALRLREAQKEARIGQRFHRTTRGRGRWGKTV